MRIALPHRPLPVGWGIAEHWLAQALRDAGHEVDRDGHFDPAVDAVVLLGRPAGWARIVEQLRRAGSGRPRVVAWMTETLVAPVASGLPWPRRTPRDLAKLVLRDRRVVDPRSNEHRTLALVKEGLLDAVATSTMARAERFAEIGIDAPWIPQTINSASWADLQLERDIPVLFLGGMTVPRRRLIARRLRRAGVPLTALGSWTDPNYWGDARTELLNRSVISLNINRFAHNFPDMRFLLAAANRSLIVSEPVYRPDLFVAGETYVEAETAGLPAVLEHWLRDHAGRERMLNAAFELVTTRLSRERSVAQLNALLEGAPTQAH